MNLQEATIKALTGKLVESIEVANDDSQPILLYDLGKDTQAVKDRENREDVEFKNMGGAMISNDDPNSLGNKHNIAMRAQQCIYKLEELQDNLESRKETDFYDDNNIQYILEDYGFKVKITSGFLKYFGELGNVKNTIILIKFLINSLNKVKEKDLND